MTQPVRRAPVVPYEVCAYRTRTGEVLRWIPCGRAPDWEQGLNLMGGWRAYPTLDKSALTKDELNGVTDPWDWSWAIVQGQKIWQAGPVLGENYSGGNVTQIYGAGLWQLLTDKRLLASPTRALTSDVKTFDADVPFGTTAYSTVGAPIPALNQNLNLRGIARRLVEIAIGISTDTRYLPITLPTDGVFTGTNARDYPGYDLSTFGRRLYELTQVDGGPEIMLIPQFTTTARKFIVHQLAIGSPRLGQFGIPQVWASNRALRKVDFVFDGSTKANRFWERGSGQERNTVLGFAEDQSGVTAAGSTNTVLEEAGTTHSQDGDINTLNGYALQDLNTNKRATLALTATVTMNGADGDGQYTESPDLSGVSPGDIEILRIRNHRRLPDGDYSVRIARMSSAGINRAKLELKTL